MDHSNATGNANGMINCRARQPQDVNNEPYIYELQKKRIPFPVTLSTDYLQSRPDLLLQLRNNMVQTIPNVTSDSTRDDIKRKRVQSHEPKLNKNAKVTSDSIADHGGDIARKYCIPDSPITVISNRGELTLVERNKVTLDVPNDVMVLTPSPQQPCGASNEQSMSSASTSKKRRKRKRKSNGSDDSMSSNGKSSDSSEGSSDHECQNMDCCNITQPVPLQKELLSRKYFDELDNYKENFEHAYDCEKTGGGEHCNFGPGCNAPVAKEYVDRAIEDIETATLDENENLQKIVYTLFHHSMSCSIQCSVPFCHDFKKGMDEILKESNLDLQQLNSTSSTEFKVVYSHTSHFNKCNQDGTGRKPVVEGADFKFVFKKFINKGSFGHVYDTWMDTSEGQTRMAVKKSGNSFSRQHLDIKIEPFIDLGKAPNLLFPDVILSSQGGLNYMIMEKAEMSLSTYCKNQFEHHKESCNRTEDHFVMPSCNGGLSPQLCSLYFYQMAQGLKYLHGHGYTHGDIKPDNVLIMPGLQEVKLCDFDFLKKEEKQCSSGTAGYDAPEVSNPLFKNVVKSSDVYSLCCCLPEMLLVFPMKSNAKHDTPFFLQRTRTLIEHISHLDEHLGVIFQHGMQSDYNLRPSVDTIVDCFERNAVMRERKLTVVSLEAPAHPHNAHRANNTTLPRKILDHWINDIMDQHLDQFLPPIKPNDDFDGSVNMEITDAVESTEDVPLAVIFEEGMSSRQSLSA